MYSKSGRGRKAGDVETIHIKIKAITQNMSKFSYFYSSKAGDV